MFYLYPFPQKDVLNHTKNYTMRTKIVLSLLILTLFCSCTTKEHGELRVLAWVGYEEPEIVKPFEEEFGIKVLTETFTGADKMFAKFTTDPDKYDVVVIDPEYISKLHERNLLSELDEPMFDFKDYITPLKRFPLCFIENKMYAVLVRFGVNALVYNSDKLTKEDVSSYQILWSPKVKGKVGIWDWYLPNMGIFSLATNSSSNPYQISDSDFDSVSRSMDRLRPQVNAVMGTFSDINAAFARGDIWVAPGLGDHTASILADDGHPIAWTVPKEGGIMWIETLGIPRNAKNRENALKYIQYIQRPQVQAKLAWRNAYRSNIPNVKGIELLSLKQQDYLKVHNGQEATDLVNSIHIRMLPTDSIGSSQEDRWQQTWQNFKIEN
jgi:spermidine/putrescine transport system substrate-binding protein